MPLSADDIDDLYHRHARALVAFFARRTYDPEAAVELMAETFAAAVTDARRFRGSGDESAAAWLFAIARNKLNGWMRRGYVERKALVRLGLEPPVLADIELERIDELAGSARLRAEVATRMEALGEDHRSALQLRVIEERSYHEVAAKLGVSEQTARARVSRAVRALGDGLELEVGEHA